MLVEDKSIVSPEDEFIGDAGAAADPFSEAASTIVVDLGIWLSGLESFIGGGYIRFADESGSWSIDSSKEFRLVHSTLQRCSLMVSRTLSENFLAADDEVVYGDVNFGELRRLAATLRESVVLSEGLIHSSRVGGGEWKAWSNLLLTRVRSLGVVRKLIREAEADGERTLPNPLLDLTQGRVFLTPEHAELALVLPRFGIVLKWLSVVGRMLAADEPLKPALLIFSRVNEQVQELTNYINTRLERFPDNEAELFSTLDAASYTASIELKKVYSQELAGLARMRPSPSIYARMETAYSLFTEGFQQILTGFARHLDPSTNIFELFPTFSIKLEQSITLRQELWELVKIVQGAEAEPEKDRVANLHAELRGFLKGSARFLFYKDTETVERFVEEILVTKQNKDLVPILHRFGAYLETLFGQVALRAVLAEHPFNGDA